MMDALEETKDVCHTEAIKNEWGYRLVNVCHDLPKAAGERETYICTRESNELTCKEIGPAVRSEECGCLCC